MVVDTAGWVARCMFGGDEMSQHHTHGLSAKRAEAEVKHTFRPSSVTVHGIAGFALGCRCGRCHLAQRAGEKRLGMIERYRWKKINAAADLRSRRSVERSR